MNVHILTLVFPNFSSVILTRKKVSYYRYKFGLHRMRRFEDMYKKYISYFSQFEILIVRQINGTIYNVYIHQNKQLAISENVYKISILKSFYIKILFELQKFYKQNANLKHVYFFKRRCLNNIHLNKLENLKLVFFVKF